jgi:hypothetical protein
MRRTRRDAENEISALRSAMPSVIAVSSDTGATHRKDVDWRNGIRSLFT